MYEVTSYVPDISELSVKHRGPIAKYIHKFFLILNHTFIDADDIRRNIVGLNHLLHELRKYDLVGEKWKFQEVQNYINYCSFLIGIPTVDLVSQQLFNFEQAEALFCEGNIDPHSIDDILVIMQFALLGTFVKVRDGACG